MKIIYIDDDSLNRTVMSEMLRLVGVSLNEAADAASGLRMIADGAYDMVLMDLRMPEMNGLTAIRHIRAQPGAGRSVPIIVVTADLTSGSRDLCRDAGADGFLDKPVSLPELYRTIGSTFAGTEGALLQ